MRRNVFRPYIFIYRVSVAIILGIVGIDDLTPYQPIIQPKLMSTQKCPRPCGPGRRLFREGGFGLGGPLGAFVGDGLYGGVDLREGGLILDWVPGIVGVNAVGISGHRPENAAELRALEVVFRGELFGGKRSGFHIFVTFRVMTNCVSGGLQIGLSC